jgi:phage tail-like protein
MPFSFQNFFFGQLPVYYKVNDTYKDSADRGLLERYLEIFGLELDEEIIPLIDDYLKIINPFETPDKFLTTLGYTLGSPPDLTGDPTKYAKLLAYIIAVYKIKGTARSLELLFELLGYNISIVEYPESTAILMDTGALMDDGNTFDSGCATCSDYEVIINNLLNPGDGGGCFDPSELTVTPEMLPLFTKIIEFNQPINADLIGLVNGGQVCEEVNYCFESAVNLSTILIIALDNGILMDEAHLMDSYEIIDSVNYVEDCEGPSNEGIGFMQIENDFIVD